MERNEIFLTEGTDYKERTLCLLEKAQLAQLIPSKRTRIGIKPNLLGPILPEEGATTHPEVVEGLIEYLHAHGFYELTVMEGSWVGDRTEDAYHLCGYDALLDRLGVPFLDMQKEKGVKVTGGGMELAVCRAALEVDFLINVPVLKGHCQTKMTCALKNMKGLLPNREKRRFHRLGLHAPIAALSAAVRQDFVLVDAICGDLTFEDGGNPVVMNRLLAARDPVLCDAVGCALIGLEPGEVGYLPLAQKMGVGSLELDAAVLRILEGEELRSYSAERARELSVPGGYRAVMKLAEKVEEVDSCSACYANLLPVLSRLLEEGLLERITDKISIGQGHRGKGGVLGVGDCTRGFARTLPGCPPSSEQMYAFLRERALCLRKD